jgi:Cu(I)/Ag(I) efflux system membrane protein CusA/SilA
MAQVSMIIGTMPFALIGGVWLIYLQGFNFSVAVGVGFIALAGVAVEIGIIMLTYIDSRVKDLSKGFTQDDLKQAITQGALRRVRPVMMTSTSIIFGLLPVLYGTGTGSEIMSRIAAPMVGGMVSALVLSLVVLPSVYYLWRR